MAKPQPIRATKTQTRVERLLEDLRTGAIEDVDELDAEDLELLRHHLGPEEFQSLLDELRGSETRD